MHTLLLQTIGPMALILSLEIVARICRVRAAVQQAKIARGEITAAGENTAEFLAELCSNVSFFILFLLYPGSSSKIFHSLLCVGFTGAGEEPQYFLRMDFSIDCDSLMYRGFMFPYAIAMLFVYPIGVPLYYALTLFRNKEELTSLQHIEISAATEKQRMKLGNYMKGKARREYQPEIDEAEERMKELDGKVKERRALMPGKLRKLTNGYEMRTYWFEIFECGRKILLVAVPIFLPQDSAEQLTCGLIICFCTFGAYMMYAPFEDDGDDLLSQLCQTQIFFSLLSSIVIKAEPNSPTMGVILPMLIALPPLVSIAFESGLLDKIRAMSSPDDNGWRIPCTNMRVGVGLRAWSYHFLERLLGLKHYVDEDELEDVDLLPAMEIDMSEIPARVKKAFEKHDEDGNGYLDYRELRKALSFYGHNVTHPQSAMMIKWYDDHPNSKLQVDEFHILIRDLEQGLLRFSKHGPDGPPGSPLGAKHIPAHVKSAFRQHDVNQNGQLEVTELRAGLAFYGVEVNDERSQEILDTYDQDQSTALSIKEFAKLIIDIEKLDKQKGASTGLQRSWSSSELIHKEGSKDALSPPQKLPDSKAPSPVANRPPVPNIEPPGQETPSKVMESPSAWLESLFGYACARFIDVSFGQRPACFPQIYSDPGSNLSFRLLTETRRIRHATRQRQPSCKP